MSIIDRLERVPGAVWVFIAVVIILGIIAWFGYPYWSPQ
jgi:predicted negative regulator of RcsB-dependent stress response